MNKKTNHSRSNTYTEEPSGRRNHITRGNMKK